MPLQVSAVAALAAAVLSSATQVWLDRRDTIKNSSVGFIVKATD
jgi:hypothetical protein